jgi:hypothetical protein
VPVVDPFVLQSSTPLTPSFAWEKTLVPTAVT